MRILPGLAGLSEVLPRPCAPGLGQNDSHLPGCRREGAGVKLPHLTNGDMPRREQGENSVGFYFPF